MADFKELNDTLKALSSDLERVNSDLTKKAEEALTEAKNLGNMTETTKAEVDKLIVAQTEATGKVEAIAARLEDIEKKSVRRGSGDDKPQSMGAQFVQSDVIKALDSNKVQAGQTYRAEVKNALMSDDVAEGVVQRGPQRRGWELHGELDAGGGQSFQGAVHVGLRGRWVDVGAGRLELPISCTQSRRASHYATPRVTREVSLRVSSRHP